ncbi:MAG: DNA polymerase IV [Candidatus Accumulibacter sp.]|jgi:DNA polymerase-4|nr:DNA polymerase IV [Accumulibacter sp.]
MPSAARRIAHLDMDAFFASVELRHYPELRGQAVVVGGIRIAAPEPLSDDRHRFMRLQDYSGRGVVTTSTYEARALGVFSGMGLMKSAALAPQAILLPAQFDAYRACSRSFKAAVAEIAPDIEDRGIDEIYIDLSRHPEDSPTLAKALKTAVRATTGLSCSVGIAPNKLLAKIGSDLEKPDGVTILTAADLETRIWPLPPRKVNGIGPKASARLEGLGIQTIGTLAATPLETLVEHFGANYGVWLSKIAQGIDERPVVTLREPKSVSREITFERDLHVRADKAELSRHFLALCARVASDMERKSYRCRTVGVKLRFADFRSLTREWTLPPHHAAIANAQEIHRAASECLRRIRFSQRIRLLGVRCGGLVAATGEDDARRQGALFGDRDF